MKSFSYILWGLMKLGFDEVGRIFASHPSFFSVEFCNLREQKVPGKFQID